MLSPGQWYKRVPKERLANARFRLQVLKKCEEDPEFRRGIMAICAKDIVFWIDTFVWQSNPLKTGEEAHLAVGPFICWDFQEDALLNRPTVDYPLRCGILWCFESKRTAVIQKSRDMGASWLFLMFQVWLCLFHKHSESLNISRNADYVDSKATSSLFWKIRYMNRWFPEWMTGPVDDTKMLIHYPKTEAYIAGEPSTGAAGVGGRAGTAFIDEFSRIKEDAAVRSGTASTASARFFNGTHQGTGTEFYKLTQQPEIVQIFMHWTQHPDKNKGLYRFNVATNRVEIIDHEYQFPHDYQFVCNGKPSGGFAPGVRSPWYDNKCSEIGSDREVAQELDINPTGSTAQFFDEPTIVRLKAEFAREHVWAGDIVPDADTFKLVDQVDGPIKFWKSPDFRLKWTPATYKIGGDLSQGTGRTNSCFTIFDADLGERVGEYVTPNVFPDVMAPQIVWLCKWFADFDEAPAELIWEMTGPGIRFGLEVIKLGFRNIFWNENTLAPFEKNPRKNPGWNPERKNKILTLGEYATALRKMDFLNRSAEALSECLLFQLSPAGDQVYHSGSLDEKDPSGAGVNHGDRVIADALAWKLAKSHDRKKNDQAEDTGPPFMSVLWRREWNNQRSKQLERVQREY